MKIRGARISDIDSIVEQGAKFYQWTQHSLDGVKYDPDAVADMCYRLITSKDSGYILVVDVDDVVSGFILVATSPFLFNPEYTIAGEIAYYLDPSLRGRKIGKKLLNRAEEVASSRGVNHMALVAMQTSMPEEVASLYLSMGYKKTETTFVKEL